MASAYDIIYVGPFGFPDGGAAARRILGNCLALRDAGFRVAVASGQMNGDDIPVSYQGLDVFSLGERTAENLPTALKHLAYVGMGKRTMAWLKGLSARPKAVVLYSGYTPYLLRLIPWSRERGVSLVFDAVEWYTPARKSQWLYSPYYWNTEAAMRALAARTGNVIAISRYLERHFADQGCSTIRVPPLLDTRVVEARTDGGDEGPRVLSYTGSPGHKDLFDAYLEAVFEADPEGTQIQLKVAGLTPQQVLAFNAFRSRRITRLPANIQAHGSVGYPEAMAITRSADFSLLLRRDDRTSRAGFPTKVVESLAVGTPVICNHTGDLAEHVRHGQEGLVCEGSTPGELARAMRAAISLPRDQHTAMRRLSRRHAESAFDYRTKQSDLADFFGTRLLGAR